MRRRLDLLFTLTTAGAAQAQLAADDFESGTLSAWLVSHQPGVTIAASAAGAHRGAWGLHIVDSEMVSVATSEAAIEKLLSTSSKNIYTRFWVRVVSQNASGTGLISV